MDNGRYISVKRIVENVYRNFIFSDEINFHDALEWIGALISIIGSPTRLEKHIAVKKIEEGRAKLPCDLHSIIQVGKRVDHMTQFGNVPKVFFMENDVVEEDEIYEPDTTEVVVVLSPHNSYFLEPMLYTGDTSFLRYHCCDIDFNTNPACGNNYQLNKNYIFTNFEEGFIEIAYLRIPLDDEGYPLIPDNASWEKACEFEVAYRMLYRDYVAGKVEERIINRVERDRNHYLAQAAIEDPTIDEMQEWTNYMQNPFRDVRPHDQFFAFVGEPSSFRNIRR